MAETAAASPKMYVLYEIVGADGAVIPGAKMRVTATTRESDEVLNKVQAAAVEGNVLNYVRLELPKGKKAGFKRKPKTDTPATVAKTK